MKKKNYEKPQSQVIEVDQTDIICVSPSTFSLENGGNIGEGNDSDWGSDTGW
ncbi:MAG: hypothetical protein MJZ36_04465 [Bacteroidaceae bacterium]|nr:hypothetical protein [Bacteroidaceae bacterium]